MDVFGSHWLNHPQKIEDNWRAKIHSDDLVLIPGDISWAKDLAGAKPDLDWIASLPGTKVMIRGNHDYWWSSVKRIRDTLPPGLHIIQNDTFEWNDFIIGGARLWDTSEYHFGSYIPFVKNPVAGTEAFEPDDSNESERIFERDLHRLKLSLEQMRTPNKTRIAMTHYPPIGADLHPSKASAILEAYGIKTCVFGHLHNIKTTLPLFGESREVRYLLTAADYINFDPIKVY